MRTSTIAPDGVVPIDEAHWSSREKLRLATYETWISFNHPSDAAGSGRAALRHELGGVRHGGGALRRRRGRHGGDVVPGGHAEAPREQSRARAGARPRPGRGHLPRHLRAPPRNLGPAALSERPDPPRHHLQPLQRLARLRRRGVASSRRRLRRRPPASAPDAPARRDRASLESVASFVGLSGPASCARWNPTKPGVLATADAASIAVWSLADASLARVTSGAVAEGRLPGGGGWDPATRDPSPSSSALPSSSGTSARPIKDPRVRSTPPTTPRRATSSSTRDDPARWPPAATTASFAVGISKPIRARRHRQTPRTRALGVDRAAQSRVRVAVRHGVLGRHRASVARRRRRRGAGRPRVRKNRDRSRRGPTRRRRGGVSIRRGG